VQRNNSKTDVRLDALSKGLHNYFYCILYV